MSALQAASTSHRKYTLNKTFKSSGSKVHFGNHRTEVKCMNSLCKTWKYSFNGYKGISIWVTVVIIK